MDVPKLPAFISGMVNFLGAAEGTHSCCVQMLERGEMFLALPLCVTPANCVILCLSFPVWGVFNLPHC